MSKKAQNYKTCKKCNENFVWFPNDAWFDESGYGYSTKLVRCTHCNTINVIGYIEDMAMQKLNRDKREY